MRRNEAEPDRAGVYDRELARGTVVNAAGALAGLTQPIFLLVAARLYSPELVGVYLIVLSLFDVAAALAHSGFLNAVTVFASARLEGPGAPDAGGQSAQHGTVTAPSAVVGLGFAGSIICSAALAVAAWIVAPFTASWLLPSTPGSVLALAIMAAALIPAAVTQVAMAATKARMRMEYQAVLVGAVRPLLMLSLAIVGWAFDAGLLGLVLSHFAAHLVVAGLSLVALARQFRLGPILAAAVRPRWDRDFMQYVVPSSLDVTLSRYATSIDVVMLAAFGFDAIAIARYAIASLLTRNLRTVRLILSTALAPVASRYFQVSNRAALEETYARLTRWAATMLVPVVVVGAILRDDVLALFHPSYAGESLFVVLLLVAPLMNGTLGLAGNMLSYARRSGLVLANSVLIAVLNTILNVLLIPRAGVLGAAIATAAATTTVVSLQVLELNRLEGVRLLVREIWQPFVGLLVLAATVGLFWDPVTLSGPGRAGLALAVAVSFPLLMLAFGHPEVRRLAKPAS